MEFAQIYVLSILLLKNVRKVYNTIEPNIINIFVNHVLFQVYLYCILYSIKEDFSLIKGKNKSYNCFYHSCIISSILACFVWH